MNNSKLRIVGWVALIVVALAIPFTLGSFRVGQFTLVLVYAVAILGLNVLVGYSGQVSLGHGAFFALGAYTCAILIDKVDFPHLLAVVPAAIVGFIAGILFGIPTLRLRGLYLALVTLGLAVAAPPLIKRFEDLTGGSQGINIPQPTSPAGLGLAQDQFLYLMTLAFAVVVFLLVRNMLNGDVGRSLVTIRDAEIVAKSTGVNLARYKTAAFAVSSACAGVAGALYVFAVGFVSPESFTLLVSIAFLAAVVVGGLATVGGAVLGALFIVFVPEYASDVNEALAGVIYGGVLILFMIFLPNGGMGLFKRIGRLAAGRRKEPEPSEADAATTGAAAGGPGKTTRVPAPGP
jgi:branched-chain amino acid transport system permease protein